LIRVFFNPLSPFSYGELEETSYVSNNLKSVMKHELLHALGFNSRVICQDTVFVNGSSLTKFRALENYIDRLVVLP